MQKNEHVHDLVNIITDKTTHLPLTIQTDFRGFADDGALIGVFEQHSFKDYKKEEKIFLICPAPKCLPKKSYVLNLLDLLL